MVFMGFFYAFVFLLLSSWKNCTLEMSPRVWATQRHGCAQTASELSLCQLSPTFPPARAGSVAAWLSVLPWQMAAGPQRVKVNQGMFALFRSHFRAIKHRAELPPSLWLWISCSCSGCTSWYLNLLVLGTGIFSRSQIYLVLGKKSLSFTTGSAPISSSARDPAV